MRRVLGEVVVLRVYVPVLSSDDEHITVSVLAHICADPVGHFVPARHFERAPSVKSFWTSTMMSARWSSPPTGGTEGMSSSILGGLQRRRRTDALPGRTGPCRYHRSRLRKTSRIGRRFVGGLRRRR